MQTKDGSWGAHSKTFVAVDKVGGAGNLVTSADTAGSSGVVIYDMIINYAGTAGIWINVYNTAIIVGATGGPVVGTNPDGILMFIKTPTTFVQFQHGRAFGKGILITASADAAGTTIPDTAPLINIGYA